MSVADWLREWTTADWQSEDIEYAAFTVEQAERAVKRQHQNIRVMPETVLYLAKMAAFRRDIANLAAQQAEALEDPATCTCTFYDLDELEPPPNCLRCAAIKAGEAFKKQHE